MRWISASGTLLHAMRGAGPGAWMMLVINTAISLLMIGATRSRALVPGRMQALAEMSYEFVASTLRSSAGPEGMCS